MEFLVAYLFLSDTEIPNDIRFDSKLLHSK